jgi:hypothetical protein
MDTIDDNYDYSDDEIKTNNVEYMPIVTFKNLNEVIINNIITRDKMSEAEIKKDTIQILMILK